MKDCDEPITITSTNDIVDPVIDDAFSSLIKKPEHHSRDETKRIDRNTSSTLWNNLVIFPSITFPSYQVFFLQ